MSGDQATPALRREIGFWGLTAIVVGGIIGSGIFALAATLGSVAGPAGIIALLLLIGVVIVLALPYAELGAAYPRSGGPYSIPRRALGNFGGFLVGWGYFLYAFTGTAAIIDVFVEYLGTYVNGLVTSANVLTWTGISVGLAFLLAYTLLNVVGVKWGTGFAMVTSFAKVIPLLLFGFIGLYFLRTGNFSIGGFAPFGWLGVAFAMSLSFFAFTGFEAAVIPSEEVRNPQRVLPRATIVGVVTVAVIYALVALSFIGGMRWAANGLVPGDWAGTSGLLLNNIADGWGLPLLAAIMVLGAVLSTLGAGGDWVLLQGRIPYAMAQDNLFFKSLSKVHPRYSTPAFALIFASALTGVTLILLPSFPEVALIASITTLVPYAAAGLSLAVLRRTEPRVPRPFRLPGGVVLAPIGFVLATILIYWASWPWTFVGPLLILVGVPLYFLFEKVTRQEARRIAWLGVYLGGLALLSYLGNPFFTYDNFLPFGPIGVLGTPLDMIVVAIFGLAIYVWGYYSAIGSWTAGGEPLPHGRRPEVSKGPSSSPPPLPVPGSSGGTP